MRGFNAKRRVIWSIRFSARVTIRMQEDVMRTHNMHARARTRISSHIPLYCAHFIMSSVKRFKTRGARACSSAKRISQFIRVLRACADKIITFFSIHPKSRSDMQNCKNDNANTELNFRYFKFLIPRVCYFLDTS